MTFTDWIKVKLGIIPTFDDNPPLLDRIMYRFGWVRAADYEEMAHRFSCVLDSATGGRMSKTNYTKDAMLEQIEDYIQIRESESVEDALKEETDAAY